MNFSYLDYKSCHPKHIKDNIALSLAKRIIRITSGNRDDALNALRIRLENRGHPSKVINFAFTKVFTPPKPKAAEEPFVFVTTYNPSIRFDKRKVNGCLDQLHGDEMKRVFGHKKIVCGYRQPPSLRNIFVQSRFDLHKPVVPIDVVGLFPCSSCIFCTGGYIPACTSFTFGEFNEFTWKYNRKFTCHSINVIYILICGMCWEFYIGQTKQLKTRAYKHKSDGRHPHNSNCRVLAHHLHNHSEFFKLYPIWYEDDKRKREFIEKQFIARYDPPLNKDR